MRAKLLAAAASVALGISGGAAQATPFDWSGIYFGVHGGMESGDATGSAGISGLFTACVFVCLVEDDPYAVDAQETYRAQGAFGGAQIGADFVNNSFLLGVVGDFSWSGMSGDGTLAGITIFDKYDLWTADIATDVKWTSTIRARAGMIGNQNTLAYVTGGLAIANVDSTLGYTFFPGSSLELGESTVNNTTRYGWTVGAGLEHPLTENVTIGLEYLYTDLGSWNIYEWSGDLGGIACPFGCYGVESTDTEISAENSLSYHAIKVMLNVKFGGGRS
jgi:outer membrane immunogenic protein